MLVNLEWEPEEATEEDKIVCPSCGKSHQLSQGQINEMMIGDGLLFYKCGSHVYVGAINKRTVFGAKVCDQEKRAKEAGL